MYKEIILEGIRGIKDLTIDEFGLVNVFVGKINCGRTTLLKGIFLLTGPTNAQLPLRINTFCLAGVLKTTR